MADPVFAVEVEFVAGSFTNITSECHGFSLTRALADFDNGLSVGRATVVLDNYERKFSPANSASPYHDHLHPGKAARLSATYGGSAYTLFTGVVDGFRFNPAPGQATATAEFSDRIKQLQFRDVKLPLRANTVTSSLFTEILSASGVDSAGRVVDAMTDTVPYAFYDGVKPLFALDEVARFGFSKLFVDTAGRVNVKARSWLYDAAAVGSYASFLGFELAHDDALISNVVRVAGTPRRLATTTQTVGWLQTIPSIVASSWLSFFLDYVDPDTLEAPTPATSMVTLVASQDYYTNTASNETGTDRTATTSVAVAFFATTAVASLFNGSGDTVYLTRFQLRGSAIQRRPTVTYETVVASSVDVYGRRELTVESDFIDAVGYARDYADALITDRVVPTDGVTVSLKNQWPDTLANDLGAVIHLVESNTAVGSLFLIQEVSHDVTLERGLEHVVTYRGHVAKTQNFLILDDNPRGTLDSVYRLAF
jgi:hypothetical protein